MSALLSLDGILVRRDRRTVLEVESLSIERGETLAIVGPNGAGKSTLLLVLARLLRPERGRLLFDKQPAESLSAKDYRRRLALVMQEPLLLNRSVSENVALGLRYRGVSASERASRVDLWLERLGIGHLATRRAGHISGGEARRASLARALVLEPALLLLDEPFGGLDTPSRQRLIGDLRVILSEARTTTVFITHQLEDALELSTRLAVILGGRIQQTGVPRDVLARPANADVSEFLAPQVQGT